MANTTWITLIKNDSPLHLMWRDGENPNFKGSLSPGEPVDYNGKGFCFPWVDHTKDELRKSIEFTNGETGAPLFHIFQSYNRDTIQWLKAPENSANHGVDVDGPSAAGGSKALYIRNDGTPVLVSTGKE
ncbi:MAG: hypothetical protein V4506_15070 [Bacteroidota bacterium]